MLIDLSNLNKMINPVYYPALKYRGRFLILYGGSGSGKSYTLADKIIIRSLKEDKHRFLCSRATGRSVSKSQFPLIKGEIERWGLSKYFDINKSIGNEKITCKLNGNEVLFSGLDDVEKLKSIYDISSVWVEEANEVKPEDFRELNRRLRGYRGYNQDGSEKYMQIMLSFNPVSELSWLKARFFDSKDKGTIILYGEEQTKKLSIDVNEKGEVYFPKGHKYLISYLHNTLIIHSTYMDNHFIDETYMQQMEELKEHDIDEYNIYALGLWGIPGGGYFNKKNVSDRIKKVRIERPLMQGYFEFDYVGELIVDSSIKWIEDKDNGYIKIYEYPKKGYPYVGGGDTAGEGSDWNVGYFTNNVTEEDACVLRINFDEDLYARQMYCLGKFYNEALLGIESNFSTHPNKELIRLGYRHMYIRDKQPDSISGKLEPRYGYLTTKLTRPIALSMLRTIVREHPERIKDLDTLEEMTVFVKDEKGKPQAAEGQHDDCVMARSINCYIAPQQRKTIKVEEKQKTVIQKDKDRLARQLRRTNSKQLNRVLGR